MVRAKTVKSRKATKPRQLYCPVHPGTKVEADEPCWRCERDAEDHAANMAAVRAADPYMAQGRAMEEMVLRTMDGSPPQRLSIPRGLRGARRGPGGRRRGRPL